MGRGLGHIQKSLLQYFAELPEGGGEWFRYSLYTDLLREFKAKQWPEIYGPEEYCPGYDQAEKNSIRVMLHNAIKSLLRRGLLRQEWLKHTAKRGHEYTSLDLYITDEGKELIVNAPQNQAH